MACIRQENIMNTQVEKKSFGGIETAALNVSTKENTKGIRYCTYYKKDGHTIQQCFSKDPSKRRCYICSAQGHSISKYLDIKDIMDEYKKKKEQKQKQTQE